MCAHIQVHIIAYGRPTQTRKSLRSVNNTKHTHTTQNKRTWEIWRFVAAGYFRQSYLRFAMESCDRKARGAAGLKPTSPGGIFAVRVETVGCCEQRVLDLNPMACELGGVDKLRFWSINIKDPTLHFIVPPFLEGMQVMKYVLIDLKKWNIPFGLFQVGLVSKDHGPSLNYNAFFVRNGVIQLDLDPIQFEEVAPVASFLIFHTNTHIRGLWQCNLKTEKWKADGLSEFFLLSLWSSTGANVNAICLTEVQDEQIFFRHPQLKIRFEILDSGTSNNLRASFQIGISCQSQMEIKNHG